jgi:hypothetical protein
MDDQDRIIKKGLEADSGPGPSAPAGDCLSEEQFTEYLQDLLNPHDREAVEQHLSTCNACLQKSIMISRIAGALESGEKVRVPGAVTEGAKRLVREESGRDVVEVVLEFGRDVVRVIKDAAGICTLPGPQAMAARDTTGASGQTLVAELRKTFGRTGVHISVEKVSDNECEIAVQISEHPSGQPLDDIRVNLISGDRELASYLTVNGAVSFKDMKIDPYTLRITKGTHSVGSVMLRLSSAP